MYKKQLKIQKIVCLFALVVAVILFLYSLGIMTDLYDSLYSLLKIDVVEDPNNPGTSLITASEKKVGGITVSGSIVYNDMQYFNRYFLNCSIVYILIVVLMFVTNTSTRRRYYITNYISIALFVAASIFIPVNCISSISYFKGQFLQIDFAALKEYAILIYGEKNYAEHYTESTMWFDLQWVVFGLMILAAILVAGICVWKIMLMKEERKLVEDGKKVKA